MPLLPEAWAYSFSDALMHGRNSYLRRKTRDVEKAPQRGGTLRTSNNKLFSTEPLFSNPQN